MLKTIAGAAVALGLHLGGAAQAAPPAPASGSIPAPEAPGPVKTFTRPQVTGIVANFRKIVSPSGVEERIAVPIGGVNQWITVRGRDRRNPILLVIHGGPASPEMPTDWMFQGEWEDYFTVVQWDQRGSGKTYNSNDPAVVGPTLSLDRITDDAGELVQYLRRTYGKDKVFVLGHSWGSLVGLSLAHKHPEWLYAYVGMGQVINGVDNERVGYGLTMEAAQAAGDAQAVKELQSIAPYPEKDGSVPLAKINLERKWSVRYGGLIYGRDELDYYYDLAKFSPDYSMADVEAIDKGSALSLPRLLPALLGFDYTRVADFQCPIIIFAGRHDFTTPSEVTAAWLTHVRAPSKKLVWFEDSAHMMAVEEPGRVLVHLVEDVRPLAGKEADAR
jgi:proline iminopeptidase